MSATNTFETALLNLYFLNADHANIGDTPRAFVGSRRGVRPRLNDYRRIERMPYVSRSRRR